MSSDRPLRVLAMMPLFNEAHLLPNLISKLEDGLVDEFLAVNDGSTDGGPAMLREAGVTVIDQAGRAGVGAALKRGVEYAREHAYDVIVVMAGNGKDDPREIPRLLAPILEDGADYVQGSRFLPGGESANLPTFRRHAIQLLSAGFQSYSARECTDLTNGFRAYRISLLDDPEIDIAQPWLDTYEYEYYVHFKAYTLGYRVAEVAVSKTYPASKRVSYSKIRPVVDWWKMLRPFVLLGLGIKK